MKPFLFIDFYKTLSHGDLWHQADTSLKERIESLLFNDESRKGMLDTWMRGELDSESINRHVAEHLGVAYETLWEIFVRSAQTIGVSQEALALVAQLRDTYTPVLITDNMDSFDRFTVPAYELDGVFEHIINSARVGMRKHDGDGKIFALVASDVTQSILIDDSPIVCDIFTDMGGVALRVTAETDAVMHLRTLIASSN